MDPDASALADQDVTVAFHGVTLKVYAGIRAAIGEGFELSDVLAQEGVAPAAWSVAERRWREALVDSPALQLALLEHERTAADCLARRLRPIDEDVEAWLGLLGRIVGSESAPAVLASHGMSLNDLDRLGRLWRKRAARDPKLATEMQRLAAIAKMPDRIEASPPRLVPFPWTRGGSSSPQARPPQAPVQNEPSQPEPAPPPVRVLASFQRAMVEPAPRVAAPPELDETLPVKAAPLHMPALPFLHGRSVPPQPLPVTPSDAFGDTVGVQAEARFPTLPFESRSLDLLRLENYADLVAALRTSPERAEEILCASGLKGADERRSVHAIWRRRFDASPELRRRLEALVTARTGEK